MKLTPKQVLYNPEQLKYAFPSGGEGEIWIELAFDDKHNFVLIVKDNGVDLPKDFDLVKEPEC